MLSTEQQRIIEDSLWVVNTVLKQMNLQKDQDLRQQAILYMCQCLERFNTDTGVKWTTYAYRNVYLYVLRTHASACKKRKREIALEAATLTISHENDMHNKILVQAIATRCTPLERRILQSHAAGYNISETQVRLGITTYTYRKCRDHIQDVAKAVLFDLAEKDPPP